MEASGKLHAPAALLSEKGPSVPTGQEAEWAPDISNSSVKLLKYISCKGILLMGVPIILYDFRCDYNLAFPFMSVTVVQLI
jgi:hypothetical protein